MKSFGDRSLSSIYARDLKPAKTLKPRYFRKRSCERFKGNKTPQ
jgi:hypothetical protein